MLARRLLFRELCLLHLPLQRRHPHLALRHAGVLRLRGGQRGLFRTREGLAEGLRLHLDEPLLGEPRLTLRDCHAFALSRRVELRLDGLALQLHRLHLRRVGRALLGCSRCDVLRVASLLAKRCLHALRLQTQQPKVKYTRAV